MENCRLPWELLPQARPPRFYSEPKSRIRPSPFVFLKTLYSCATGLQSMLLCAVGFIVGLVLSFAFQLQHFARIREIKREKLRKAKKRKW